MQHDGRFGVLEHSGVCPHQPATDHIREATVAAHEPNGGWGGVLIRSYMDSKQSEFHCDEARIVCQCQAFKINQSATACDLRVSVNTLNIYVHDIAIRKRPNKSNLKGRNKPLFSQKSKTLGFLFPHDCNCLRSGTM